MIDISTGEEVLEGRSIDYDNSITRTVRQEEEGVLSVVNRRDPVFRWYIPECVVMRFPLCSVSPHPSLHSIFRYTFSVVSNHLVDPHSIFQIDQVH